MCEAIQRVSDERRRAGLRVYVNAPTAEEIEAARHTRAGQTIEVTTEGER